MALMREDNLWLEQSAMATEKDGKIEMLVHGEGPFADVQRYLAAVREKLYLTLIGRAR